MNIRQNEALRERLAAEYVLGTLKGRARRRFDSWLPADAALRRAVAEWQDRLFPLAEFAPAVQPPAHAWRAIEQQLDRQAAQRSDRQPGLRDNVGFWRRIGMVSSAVALAMVALVFFRQPGGIAPAPGAPGYVATLSDAKAQPMLVVAADVRRERLTVRIVTPQTIAADKSLELWALPKDGPPRSLGLVAANGTVSLPMPQDLPPDSVAALAVSLEPKAGSPNPHAPSGPVLYTGPWIAI
ncbi:hypothetical protein E4K72_22865 [Oxalobacteraceae bacterium OM1]|nr:hypothetical protein E4K72_22865 [Oxalobacteraceae bacterium OM1]